MGIGLALSGGGAKGAAHIGVLQAYTRIFCKNMGDAADERSRRGCLAARFLL